MCSPSLRHPGKSLPRIRLQSFAAAQRALSTWRPRLGAVLGSATAPIDAGYRRDADWGWDESCSEEEATAAEAGEEFAPLLIRLRLQGTLSAKQACVLAHWATAAGALGPCALFAMGPNAPSGHYQRRLDSYLGVAEVDASFYHVDVPGHDKAQAFTDGAPTGSGATARSVAGGVRGLSIRYGAVAPEHCR